LSGRAHCLKNHYLAIVGGQHIVAAPPRRPAGVGDATGSGNGSETGNGAGTATGAVRIV